MSGSNDKSLFKASSNFVCDKVTLCIPVILSTNVIKIIRSSYIYVSLLYPPQTKLREYIVILMSVRPFVRPSVRPSQSLIRYSSKTAEQNFMKLSGIVHNMMSYCTSYFKFLSAWFWGFPEQNKDFAITTYGGGISNPLPSKTAGQNFMKLSGIVHYMKPYCTSYFKFLSAWFWGFPEQNNDFAIQNMGERGVSFCEHCSQYF